MESMVVGLAVDVQRLYPDYRNTGQYLGNREISRDYISSSSLPVALTCLS